MQPLVSVVIPTYNRMLLVQEAVASVLACSSDSVEVVVVDDGSTDGTAAGLARFGAAMTIVRQSNQGRSAARNAGAAVARGRYLAFLDSDDVWEPWHVAQFAAAHPAEPYDLYAAPVNYWDPVSGRLHLITTKTSIRPRDDLEASLVGTTLTLQGLFVPRELFEATGGFDVDLKGSEDWLFGIQLTRAAQAVHHLPRASARVRLHEGRSMSDVDWDVTWRRRACARVLDGLTPREAALARAGTARYCAARLYEVGRMQEARAELSAARAELAALEGLRSTGRLEVQTHLSWLMPYARRVRNRLRT